ncbi:MAG TPA: DUF481 domain-containing protein [Desulfurivibrionaceae bacterium]|nr:DUF481 domain-containing protein [Desulfurivibrionaceae bacterium]
MKFWRFITLLPLLIGAMPAPGRAEEQAPARNWSDEAEFSYVKSGGNSRLETLSFKNLFTLKHHEKWQSSLKLASLNGKSDGSRNSESYKSELRTDYALSERLYTLAIAGWLKDNYSGIDSRYNLGPGLGYKWLAGPGHLLNSEAGLEYVMEKNTDATENDFLRGRLFALYEYRFSQKNKFSQALEYLYDFDDSRNYNLNTLTAVTSALNSHWSLKAGYEIKYDNRPVPATLEKKETVLTMALVLNL